jgi:hypothetical protein
MIALAVQIRLLFLLLAVGLAVWLLWRLWSRVAQDPRLRASMGGASGPLLLLALLRAGLPLLLRVLRGLRYFR